MGRFRNDDDDSPAIIGEGECTKETGRAILVQLEDRNEEVWIPKSVLEDSEVNELGDTGNVSVKAWWARKEGWI